MSNFWRKLLLIYTNKNSFIRQANLEWGQEKMREVVDNYKHFF